ncbi:GA-like domain-containing protein [Streptococcus halotolerans]|uniref:GA-like domain-containing protein n=1 Tax=Streptococcus halotolerans TaxID=1814128 RepID=UPI000788D962|nr:YSIRK-type signal peptide-containing protein [Streptococcus halotolerans]
MFHEQKDRFSIRKFKVGVGSVFLGSFLLVAPQVYAEETANVTPGSELITKQAELKPADLTEETPSAEETTQLAEENTAATKPVNQGQQATPEAISPNQVEEPQTVEDNDVVKTVGSDAEDPATKVTETQVEKSAETFQNGTDSAAVNDTEKTEDKVEERAAEAPETPVSPSALQSTAPQFALGAAEYIDKARLVVTKKNMVNHFIVGGTARGDNEKPVTLTEDTHSQAGSLALSRRINMNESFRLEGKVNIGNKYEGKKVDERVGGDGLAAVFTTAEPGTVGKSGASIGLGDIPNSFGFKLDTWHNTSAPEADQKAGPDPKYGPGKSWENGAFGAFYRTDAGGRAITESRDVQKLNTQPENNEFKPYVVSYDGTTKEMTVEYNGQRFTKNISSYLNASRNTTKQQAGKEHLSFALFASTGTGTNKHQFDLERFEYSAGGSYVSIRHVDDATGELIKETLLEGTIQQSADLTGKLAIDDYELLRTNANTAPGYQSDTKIGFKPGIQTVTYTYRKIVKDELKELVDAAPEVKKGSAYDLAEQGKKGAYDAAINEGTTVKDTATTQKQVDESIAKINKAIDDLNLSAATKAVEVAVAAGKEGKQKRDSVLQQEEITDADKKAVDDLNKTTESKKEIAETLVEKVTNVEEKQKLQEKLDKIDIKSVDVKEKEQVNKEKLKKLVDDSTAMKNSPEYKLADQAQKVAYDETIEIAKDLVLNNKAAKQDEVDKSVTNIEKGIADLNLSAATNAVKEAEEAGKKGNEKRGSVLKQDEINEADKNAVDELNKATNEKIELAKALVEKVANAGEKQKLQDKLNNIEIKSVDVTPKDQVDKAKLKEFVDGETAIKQSPEYKLSDSAVRGVYDDVISIGKKVLGDEKASQENVNNSINGIKSAIDALNISAAKAAVKAAEASSKAGEQAKTKALTDNKIDQSEKDKIDKLDEITEAAKKKATDLVNALKNETSKTELLAKLDKVQPQSVEVTSEEKVDTDKLQKLVDDVTNIKQSKEYQLADLAVQDAYDTVIAVGKKILNDDTMSQKQVDGSIEEIEKAINALKISAAKKAVEAAEAAGKAGKEKRDSVLKQDEINEADKKAVDELNKTTNEKIELAKALVEKVANAGEKQKLQDELNNIEIKSVDVTPKEQVDKAKLKEFLDGETAIKQSKEYELADPAVQRIYDDAISIGKQALENEKASQENVNNSIKGINSAIDALNISAAKAAVKAAEDAGQKVQEKIKEVKQDDLIKKEEKDAVDKLNEDIITKKNKAQGYIDKVTDPAVEKELRDRLNKVTIEEVKVNDANNNGAPDSEDEAAATKAVEESEAAKKIGDTKREDVVADGIINPTDKQEVDDLNKKTNDNKDAAEKLVENLPDGKAKEALKDRLGKVTTKEVEVNDQNSDGIPDDEASAIAAAEAAGKVGEQAKINALTDNKIDQSEKDKIDKLDEITEAAKKKATDLVNALKNETLKTELLAKLDKVQPQSVEVTPEEKVDTDKLQKLVDDETNIKQSKEYQLADPAVRTIYDEALEIGKKTLKDGTADQNRVNSSAKGIEDAINALKISAARKAVEVAEVAGQKGTEAKAKALSDNKIDQTDKEKIDKLDETTEAAKKKATELVNALTDEHVKADLLEKLANVKTQSVQVTPEEKVDKTELQRLVNEDSGLKESPTYTLADEAAQRAYDNAISEGKKVLEDTKADQGSVTNSIKKIKEAIDALNKSAAKKAAENDATAAVQEAEDASAAVETKKQEFEQKKAITEEDKQEVDKLIETTKQKKAAADKLVKSLSNEKVKEELQARLDKIVPKTVEVNDTNKNNIPDDVDAAIKSVEEAEKANAAVEAKKKELETKGAITKAGKEAVDQLIETTQQKKAAAEKLVNALTDETNKEILKGRLDTINPKTVEVNDEDANGVPDDVDKAIKAAAEAVKAAEEASKAGKDKKTEVEEGGVTQSEKNEIDQLNKATEEAKKKAEELVKKLPDDVERKSFEDRLKEVMAVEVKVTDQRTPDAAEAAKKSAESAVKAAEEAGQKGKAEVKKVKEDGLIKKEEKAAVDKLNEDTTDKKNAAQGLVDKVTDPTAKKELQDRLDKVTVETVDVNDKDDNGIADDVDKAIKAAEDVLKESKEAGDKGKAKVTEVKEDGLINTEEKAAVDELNKATNAKKAKAKTLIEKVTDEAAKAKLEEKLNQITTEDVTVNDKDGNNIADDIDEAIKAAESAGQKGKDKVTDVKADGVVNPNEKQAVDNLNDITNAKKDTATDLLKNLPESDAKAKLQERLDKVTTEEVDVNDTDGNGIPDDVDAANKAAEEAVKAAEAAAQAVKAKKADVEKDGLVDLAEKAEVDSLNQTTIAKKATAADLVDKLPAGPAKEGLKARLDNVMTSEVVVNDANSNGKDDSQDDKDAAQALAAAEAAVKAAEEAAQAGKAKKFDVEKDGLVNPAEKSEVDGLNQATTAKKSTATDLVDKLPDGPAKTALKARLDQVKTSEVVVNDANSNGKADSQDAKDTAQAKALAAAESAVKAAEAAAQAGKAKKVDIEKDGLVNPAEKAEVDNLNQATAAEKSTATDLVNKLPEGPAKEGLKARLDKVTTETVDVNDKDGNGIPDDVDAANKTAEEAVKAAEVAAQAGKAKKSDVEKDGLVNPAEKSEVDGLNQATTAKKSTATDLVDQLPEGPVKEGLKARLDKVMTSEVTVNDANSNDKADSQDDEDAAQAQALAAAESTVKAAEEAAQAGKAKKVDVEKDGLVNPAEKAEVDGLNQATTTKKATATDLVDKLPDGPAKTALKARLDQVKTSEVIVNDANSNGKADSQDDKDAAQAKALAAAEAAVKAAEEAAQAGKAKKSDVKKDGLVNPAEKAEVDSLNQTTIAKKATAADLVDKLPAGPAKEGLKARLDNVMTSEVVVNDANSNGKDDSQDDKDAAQALAAAEAAVKAAEEAAQAGKAKKSDVEKDGLVNPTEKAEMDNLNQTTIAKKATATDLFNQLPTGPAKEALKARLDKVMTSEVVVNDANSNGKADSQDDVDAANKAVLAAAESTVKAAEAAAQAGKDKKAAVEKDGLVNPAEKAEVDNLNQSTAAKKATATDLVNKLPEGPAKEGLKARLDKVMTSEVTVNDANSNGKADSQDDEDAAQALADAEAAVKAAEDAAQAGASKKADVEKDGLVNPAEKAEVDNLNQATTAKKATATDLVDKLPDGPAKAALKARLDQVKTSEVIVNDANSNGKSDSQEIEKPELDPKVDDSEKGNSAKTGHKVVPMGTKPAGRIVSSQSVKTSTPSQTKSDESLPRTGERSNSLATIYGGVTIALTALFAFKKRKRDREE